MKELKDVQSLDYQQGEILLFDKPLCWTSFQVVGKIRYVLCKFLGIKTKNLKVGHAGTLDPMATGLLVVCTGKATKQIEQFQYQTKEYVATLHLGATTPSFDTEHEIDAYFPTEHITRALVDEVLSKFVGTIEQIPPAFSAVKVDGQRAFALARQGQQVDLKTKTLVIDEIEVLHFALPELKIRVVCSKGTYIRALARDIGVALKSGAYLTALRRVRIGDFSVEDAFDLGQYLDQFGVELQEEEFGAKLSDRKNRLSQKKDFNKKL